MEHKAARKGVLWIAAGLLLIAAALGILAYNLWDDERASEAAAECYARLEAEIPKQTEARQDPDSPAEVFYPDHVLNPGMEMPTLEIDGYDYIGTLEIPALELSLPVLSQWSDGNLKVAPCRYSGSAYLDNMVIAAHNYTAHFGNLKNLAVGDTVVFTDVDGNVFPYAVSEMEQLKPTEVEEMQAGDWALSLFTCTVGGQYRVVVRCVPGTVD